MEEIGKGGYGQVYSVKDKNSGQLHCMKIVSMVWNYLF